MNQHLGVSRMMVQRVWQRHEIQPHRVEKFKLSNDPKFDEKLRGIVGLHLNPPEQALVLIGRRKEPNSSAGSDGADPALATWFARTSNA